MTKEIESRATPLLDNAEDKGRFRVRSSVGFLDAGESFLECLDRDAKKVDALGTTHRHLASELERVLKEAQNERKRVGAGPDRPISIDFEYQPHPNETSSTPNEMKIQRLCVSRRSFMGSQWSFFRNLDPDHVPTEEDSISWKEDHEVYNQSFPQIVITVAGGVGTGICHYISKYGFYEGGKSNRYRIDPAVLHWVITGIPSADAKKEVLSFCQASKNALRAQLEQQLRDFDLANSSHAHSSSSTVSIPEEIKRSFNDEISRFEDIEASLKEEMERKGQNSEFPKLSCS